MTPSSDPPDYTDLGPGDAFQRYSEGDLNGAKRIAVSVLKRQKDEGNHSAQAHSWLFIGLLHYKAGDWEESLDCMGSALVAFTAMVDRQGVGRCHRWLARINERCGKIEEAEAHFRWSWTAYVSSGDRAAVAAVSLDIGDMRYLRNDSDEAALWWVRSWNIAESERFDSVLDAVAARYGVWCNRYFGSP